MRRSFAPASARSLTEPWTALTPAPGPRPNKSQNRVIKEKTAAGHTRGRALAGPHGGAYRRRPPFLRADFLALLFLREDPPLRADPPLRPALFFAPPFLRAAAPPLRPAFLAPDFLRAPPAAPLRAAFLAGAFLRAAGRAGAAGCAGAGGAASPAAPPMPASSSSSSSSS